MYPSLSKHLQTPVIFLRRYAPGHPKAVLHTQRQVMTNAARAVDMCKLTTCDVWFHAAPMFHAMGEEGQTRGAVSSRTHSLFSLVFLLFSSRCEVAEKRASC
jgi:hypothetical protein